jgi:hypothetical protein
MASAILDKVRTELKDAKEPLIKPADRFCIIGSRALTEDEQKNLSEYGVLCPFESFWKDTELDQIFTDRKATYVSFDISQDTDRLYIRERFKDIKGLEIIILKRSWEDNSEEEWIQSIKDNTDDRFIPILKQITRKPTREKMFKYLRDFTGIKQPGKRWLCILKAIISLFRSRK